MRFSDIFVPPLAFTELFLSAPNMDEAPFRARVEQELSKARLNAIDSGYSEADINQALFAVVAWIDEVVMCSTWSGAAAWRRQPLQKALFNTTTGGVEFFSRLDKLRGGDDAVREVYFLCLTLGFKGCYANGGDDRSTLNAIKAGELKLLSGSEEPLTNNVLLFPQAYNTVIKNRPKKRSFFSHYTLTLLLVPIGIFTILYSVFWFVLKNRVDDVLHHII